MGEFIDKTKGKIKRVVGEQFQQPGLAKQIGGFDL